MKWVWPAVSSSRPVYFLVFILKRKYLDLQVGPNKNFPELYNFENIVEKFFLVSKHAA